MKDVKDDQKSAQKAFLRAGDSTFYWIAKSDESKMNLLIGWRFLHVTYDVQCETWWMVLRGYCSYVTIWFSIARWERRQGKERRGDRRHHAGSTLPPR